MRRRPTGSVALAVTVTFTFAACAGDDDTADDTATAAGEADEPTAEQPTSPAPTATASTPTTSAATTSTATASPTSTTAAPTTTATTTVAPSAEPTPFAPIEDGPYDVGVATIVLPDTDRPLTVDVWFPIDADAAALSPQRYSLLPGVHYESPAALAATPDLIAGDGPFPLVVYSHGSGGLRYIHSSMTEGIASHGYVVAAPDHTGNTAIERIADTSAPTEEIALARPDDVRRVVDAFVDPGDPDAGPYAAEVDADRVAVAGHSFGGFTAIAAVTGFGNEVGTVEPDERVDAIIALAPAVSNLLTDDLLATIDVPILAMVGSDDVTTPPDPNVTRLWSAISESQGARPAYRIELIAAEHQTFTDICAYQEAVPTLPDVPEIIVDTIDTFAVEGCSPGDMPAERAIELTDTYVIGFLDEVFAAGDPLDPDAVAPPDDVSIEAR